jgi:ATP adenylyltransferase
MTMNESEQRAERNANIWAPWRIEYIRSLADEEQGCFLCRYGEAPSRDSENMVLWRGTNCFALLNRFPYTGGHTLVSPLSHVGGLEGLGGGAMCEMFEMVRDLQCLLSKAIGAEGFNVGMNIGRCAGAGLPGHLHLHVVPRWRGDTNFMPIFGNVTVIPQVLGELYTRLCRIAAELNLPKLS